MPRIRSFLFLSLLVLAPSARGNPAAPPNSQARATYERVHKLIVDHAHYRVDPAKLAAIDRAIARRSPDEVTRACSYEAATDRLVALLKERDRYARLETPQANQVRVAPASNNVTAHRLPGDIGIVKVKRFRGPVGSQMQTALAKLSDEKALHGMVLDLRGNLGGLVHEAVAVLSQLLPANQQLQVDEFGPAGKPYRVKTHLTDPNFTRDTTTPLVVLVNKNSASASEITTGVLKDYGRAHIFGEPTYGKGIGQLTWTLPDGRLFTQTEFLIKLPKSGAYQGQPLQPDETLTDAKARVAASEVRVRGDQLLRGALLYLWKRAEPTN